MEGDAIIKRFPHGDRLLTMDDFVSELGLPSNMPSETRRRRYQFSRQVWFPKVKFAVDFNLPPPGPISQKELETTKPIVTKWMLQPTIPRKRKRMSG